MQFRLLWRGWSSSERLEETGCDERSQNVESQTHDSGGLRTIRQNLFSEYDDREENHPDDVHHAGGDQHGEQRPAAAEAVEPMPHSHLKSADRSIAPVLLHEGKRRAAMAEANIL